MKIKLLFVALLIINTSFYFYAVDIFEISYDSNETSSNISLNREGHLIHFFPIDKKISIKSVNIYCTKSDNYSKNPKLFILNSNYKIIYFQNIDSKIFPAKPSWVSLVVNNNIIVDKDFYVLFITNSEKGNGIYLFYTNNKNDNHSDIATLAGLAQWNFKNMQKENTNWKIRIDAKYLVTDMKVTEESKEFYFTSLEQAVNTLNNPEKLSIWMLMNLSTVSKYGQIVGTQTPEDTLKLKTGNCLDFAIFSFYILKNNNYNPKIMFIQLSNNDPKNHSICIFQKNKKIFKIDNGELSGSYNSYEEISKIHDSKWWRYLLFDSVESAVEFKKPIEEVYKK